MARQHITVKGLVIRETDFDDHDRYITLLTGELGKIEVLCRGLRRKKGRLAGATALFQYSEFTLFAGRQYLLNDASLDTPFWGVTGDIEHYALSCYLAELSDIAGEEEETAKAILPMLLRALYAMENQHRQTQAVKAAFEMRLCCLMGFWPELNGCAACGETEGGPWSFLLENGALMCNTCRRRVGGTYFPVSAGTLTALRYIVSCPDRRMFAFVVNDRTAGELSVICEKYVQYHLDIRCKTLDFYHSLFKAEN